MRESAELIVATLNSTGKALEQRERSLKSLWQPEKYWGKRLKCLWRRLLRLPPLLVGAPDLLKSSRFSRFACSPERYGALFADFTAQPVFSTLTRSSFRSTRTFYRSLSQRQGSLRNLRGCHGREIVPMNAPQRTWVF